MEKKEREELKERFMNLVVDGKREKITVKDLTATAMMIRNSQPDYSVLLNFIEQELDKAKEEGFDSGVEKTVNIIQEGLDELLLEKDGEKYWVGDILRDCGSSVEKILPQNMKHYLLSKLKDNK